MITFVKRRPSHTDTCEANCETNRIVSTIATQKAKIPYTCLCDVIRIAKVLQSVEFDSTKTHKHVSLCRKEMEERV